MSERLTEETGQEILGELVSIRQLLEKLMSDGLPGSKPAASDPALEKAHYKCPVCNSLMRLRHNRTDGTKFFGCTAFPSCRGVRDISGNNARPDQPAPFDAPKPTPPPAPRPSPAPSGGGFDDWQEDDDIPF